MIIISIVSYVERKIGQKENYFSAQILFYAMLILLRQVPKIHVVIGARGSHLFGKFAHCSPLLFAQSQRCSGPNLFHDILFYEVGDTYISSCFRRGLPRFRLW